MQFISLKNQKHLLLLFLLSFSIILNSLAADKAKKFGNVSIEEVQQKSCTYYPDAHAEYLLSKGDLRIDQGKAYYYVHNRVKIYTDEGKDEATVSIRYYAPLRKDPERVTNLKAFTYNIDNGELVKTKMEKADKFDKRVNDYLKELTFVIPNVKAGSVFEYSYVKETEYLRNIPNWQLQYDIPCAFNKFTYDIEEYFIYKIYITGNVYDTNTGKKAKDNWGFNSYTGTLESTDIKPIFEEPYQPNMKDVYGKVNFQLVKYLPTHKNYSSDYEALSKNLMDSESFGRLLKKKGILKALNVQASDQSLKGAQQIYRALQHKVTHNGYGGVYSRKFGKKLITDGTGLVQDINLTYIAALNEAGFDAHPVILSTRGHGFPHPVFADIGRFNFVVAGIKYEDKWYTADASSKMPFGVLPVKCLNTNGRVVNKDGGEWINLKEAKTANNTVMVTASLKDGQYIEEVTIRWANYEAFDDIQLLNEEGLDQFKTYLKERFEEKIEDIEVKSEGFEKPLNITFKYINDITNDDMLYINPVRFGAMIENPFQREVRFSSIDIPYASKDKVIYKLNYGADWTFDLPEAKNLAMENKNCTYSYLVSDKNGTVDIISELKLMETDFLAEEYPMLKSFFEAMTSLNNELLVAKRKP